jgi:predicted sulfurtransferase
MTEQKTFRIRFNTSEIHDVEDCREELEEFGEEHDVTGRLNLNGDGEQTGLVRGQMEDLQAFFDDVYNKMHFYARNMSEIKMEETADKDVDTTSLTVRTSFSSD